MSDKQTSGLTAKDIVNIIRAGHGAKVESLCFNGLTVTYLKEQASSPPEEQLIFPPAEASAQPITQALSIDENMQQEMLMITDPAQYEDSLFVNKDV